MYGEQSITKSVGPFMGTKDDLKRKVGKRAFRIVSYQAYNAMGLIGPESNGVAVLDEDRRTVVTDELCRQDSGYFGVSAEQSELARRMAAMPDDEFKAFVSASPRLRDPDWL